MENYGKKFAIDDETIDRNAMWIRPAGHRIIFDKKINKLNGSGKWLLNVLFSCCFSAQGDSSSSCAAEVHSLCSKRFIDLMKQNERICADSVQWFACYTKTADEKNCNSPTIRQYANFVEEIGVQLVGDALFANSCKNEL